MVDDKHNDNTFQTWSAAQSMYKRVESKEEEEKSYATAIHGSAMLGTFFLLDLRIYCLRMKRELYIQLPQQTGERKLGRGVIYTSGIVRVRLATTFPFHFMYSGMSVTPQPDTAGRSHLSETKPHHTR